MKILHTADWHLGNVFHGYARTDEHRHFLAWLLDVLRLEQPDALVIAGDVFDSANPPAAAERLFYDFLLDATEAVERRLGRTCKSHDGAYADRTIDLDLIMLGRTVCADERLTLPHPRYHLRRFVMEPLMAVAPEMADPVSRLTVAQMMERLNRPRIDALPRRTADDAEALAAACADINALLPALTAHAAPLTPATLAALLRNAMTTIYLCRDEEERVAGMATLCLCASPTGTKAWVEDVVVRPDCRGRGYGAALIAHLTAESRRMGAKSLNLTSKPQREAANRLYQRMGFVLRETNVYRKESQ